MFGIIGLVLILAIVSITWATSQRHRPKAEQRWAAPSADTLATQPGGAAPPGGATPSGGAAPNPLLVASLEQWKAAGLIDERQATAIAAFEAQAVAAMHAPTGALQSPKPRRIPLVAEALGYLGGTLGVVGLVLLITKYWPDMATAVRLIIAIGGALLLTIGGFLVRADDDGALQRLQSFLWLGATAAGAVAAGVVAVDVFDAKAPGVTGLACVATVCVHSALLWQVRFRPVQQFTCVAALPVATGLAVRLAANEGPTGLSVWAVGIALLLVGLAHIGTLPPITLGVGAAASLIGAGVLTSHWRSPGMILLVLTAVGILGLAGTVPASRTAADRIVLTVVGAVGLLQATPVSISHFAHHGGMVTGLVVWAAGVALVLLADSTVVTAPVVTRLLGGAAIVGGAAVTGAQSVAFATLFGLCTAVLLIVIGTLPERVLMSLFGSLGLLVNVPWGIAHFFPGEGRAPLLILVSGMLIVAVAVWLTRQGGRIRHEFRHAGHT